MKTFRVEVTATKIVEVTLSEEDLGHGETDIEDGAANLAVECLFHNAYPDMVKVFEDWDVTVEQTTEVKRAA